MSTPTLASALKEIIKAQVVDVHVSMPAKVISYNSNQQSVNVQPLLRKAFLDEAGERQIESLPVIGDVPVVFPGSGGTRIIFPISAGDTVLLIFSEASLDKWLVRGGEVDPEDDRHHALSDAVAIPGLQDFAHVSTASPSIEITSSVINAGGSSALALKSDVQAIVSAISGAAVVATDGGAAFKANIMAALSGIPVGTTVLKGA